MSPTGKSFRFVSCVRAVCMSSQIQEKSQARPLSLFPFGLAAFSLSVVVLCLDLPKHGFGPDSDPHGSKSGSVGIPWQLFSSRISWQPPNPAIMSKMDQNIKGFGSRFFVFFRISPK